MKISTWSIEPTGNGDEARLYYAGELIGTIRLDSTRTGRDGRTSRNFVVHGRLLVDEAGLVVGMNSIAAGSATEDIVGD